MDSSRFLDFRKCKRCEVAKPIKDVGALASALKKQRLESRWKEKMGSVSEWITVDNHSHCNEVKLKANRRDDTSQTAFAGPERDARVQQRRERLSGLRYRGEEECSHSSYDLVLSKLEKNWLTYLEPDNFPTRRSELMQKKPNKEISIDQSQLVVKDKQLDLTFPTVTELEISNALKRCALASDLVGVCTYDVMATYSVSLHVRKAKHIQAKCPKPIATGPDLAHNFELSNSCLPPIADGRTSAPKAATSAKLQSSKKRSRSANRQSQTKGKGKNKSKARKGSSLPAPKCSAESSRDS